MCGIAGIVGDGAKESTVRRMMGALAHRGPDGSGYWTAPGIGLGHTRLKILDLSDAGRQPMHTPEGRFSIVFNGEVYNYRELREELGADRFRTQTDTEVILHAFAHWGEDCLRRFVGMFSLAIWDARDRKLFCARDRLGIKPFYYCQLEGCFLFASEIRALLAAGVQAEVNESVLFDFLARDYYEHTDETFFQHIHKLPAGHFVCLRSGSVIRPRRYWKLAEEAAALQISANPIEREDRLIELMRDAVRLHLRSDVPIGVALSGGLDSGTLLALLDEVHEDPAKVEAFSFCFAEEAYSERPHVEIMAQQTGRAVHFVEVRSEQFTATEDQIGRSQEEPYAGLPIFAYSLCYELARQKGFVVMMDGSGVDEGLAGYGRFNPAWWADLFISGQVPELCRELLACGVLDAESRRVALEKMQAAAQATADIGRGQDLTRSVRPDCLHPDFVRRAERAIPEMERPFADCLHNLMYRDLTFTKLPRALRFRDRLSMRVGTELRPPFLDHRLIAYEFALPAKDLIHGGVNKAILRRAASRLLPDAVRLASKRSVQTPQREWFRGPLRNWVREKIDQASFWDRGWIDKRRGRAAMEAYFQGEGDNSFFLWQWINLAQWARAFLDVNSNSVGGEAA